MKLIQILRMWKARCYQKISAETVRKIVHIIFVLGPLSALIWFAGPHLMQHGKPTFLLDAQKRIYAILFLWLLGLIKLLLFDFERSNNPNSEVDQIKTKIKEMRKRFYGAIAFLKKNNLLRNGKTIRLNTLPWFLLIGPQSSGKTTFLAKSNVQFFLQKQIQTDVDNLLPSNTCDWWVTKDACIIDVPGSFCFKETQPNVSDKLKYSKLWQNLLKLIRKKRGQEGIQGIILALPLAEWMRYENENKLNGILNALQDRLFEASKIFSHPLECYITFTKCDLMPGFGEFFSESSYEESIQPWGIPLSILGTKTTQELNEHFNALIKKLNHQLLWRLHHEKSQSAKPLIKDFPLQIEKLKSLTIKIFKTLSPKLPQNLVIKGIYLTSACQKAEKAPLQIFEGATKHEVQLLKEPTTFSRPYFLKQFFNQVLSLENSLNKPAKRSVYYYKLIGYTASLTVVAVSGFYLVQDFRAGMSSMKLVQKSINNYKKNIQFTSSIEQLKETLSLLNTLDNTDKNTQFKSNHPILFSYYTFKTKQKTNLLYQQVLKTILLPDIKSYFEEYLKNAVNNNTDNVYAVLKGYLMLQDKKNIDETFLISTLIPLINLQEQTINVQSALLKHLHNALQINTSNFHLDNDLIERTRFYFISMSQSKLSEILLKNIDNNKELYNINESITNTNVFNIDKHFLHIPKMFTVANFSKIMSHDLLRATQESMMGNWVLGEIKPQPQAYAESLMDERRKEYINQYIEHWERITSNLHLDTPKDLLEMDKFLETMIQPSSPLVEFFKTVHDNTYFEPLTTESPNLKALGSLLEKHEHATELNTIVSSLKNLHELINHVQHAPNRNKAAYEVITAHMLSTKPDTLKKIHALAEKNPAPLKNWLNQLANQAWHLLMIDATHYLDLTWQDPSKPNELTRVVFDRDWIKFEDDYFIELEQLNALKNKCRTKKLKIFKKGQDESTFDCDLYYDAKRDELFSLGKVENKMKTLDANASNICDMILNDKLKLKVKSLIHPICSAVGEREIALKKEDNTSNAIADVFEYYKNEVEKIGDSLIEIKNLYARLDSGRKEFTDSLRGNILSAIERYMNESLTEKNMKKMDGIFSSQRIKDVKDLLDIIQQKKNDGQLLSDAELRKEILQHLPKIKNGGFFQLGNSALKYFVLEAIVPKNTPYKGYHI